MSAPRQSASGILIFAFAAATTLLLAIPISLAAETPLGKAEIKTGEIRHNEWPQFLGPHRNGISDETEILDTWPADGPPVVWRVPGGVGMSGIAIRGGRLLTMVQRDGRQLLIALEPKTGKRLWQTPIAPEYDNQMGAGPRSTPTIAGERAFVFSGEGVLAAVNVSDGKVLWTHNTLKELKGKPADYGMACSPLVVGDQVIVTIGAPNATVVALNATTGETVWTAGEDPAGYSSPALLDVGGAPQIVTFTGSSVLGLKPASGAILWRYPYVTEYDCNIATPIAHEGRVFISSGENHGSVLLALKPNGNTFEPEPVWSSQGTQSVLRNEWQTSVLLDGHLYGFDNVGSAGPVTHLTCVNADMGERVWQKTRFGKGNLIAADGKLLISTMKGELVMVRATPKEFDEIGRKVVLGSTRQAPALSGGMVYLRDDAEIVCLDLRRSAP